MSNLKPLESLDSITARELTRITGIRWNGRWCDSLEYDDLELDKIPATEKLWFKAIIKDLIQQKLIVKRSSGYESRRINIELLKKYDPDIFITNRKWVLYCLKKFTGIIFKPNLKPFSAKQNKKALLRVKYLENMQVLKMENPFEWFTINTRQQITRLKIINIVKLKVLQMTNFKVDTSKNFAIHHLERITGIRPNINLEYKIDKLDLEQRYYLKAWLKELSDKKLIKVINSTTKHIIDYSKLPLIKKGSLLNENIRIIKYNNLMLGAYDLHDKNSYPVKLEINNALEYFTKLKWEVQRYDGVLINVTKYRAKTKEEVKPFIATIKFLGHFQKKDYLWSNSDKCNKIRIFNIDIVKLRKFDLIDANNNIQEAKSLLSLVLMTELKVNNRHELWHESEDLDDNKRQRTLNTLQREKIIDYLWCIKIKKFDKLQKFKFDIVEENYNLELACFNRFIKSIGINYQAKSLHVNSKDKSQIPPESVTNALNILATEDIVDVNLFPKWFDIIHINIAALDNITNLINKYNLIKNKPISNLTNVDYQFIQNIVLEPFACKTLRGLGVELN